MGEAPPGRPLRPTQGSGAQPRVGGAHFKEEREALRDSLILRNLAKGARTAYATGWRQWLYFMKARGQSPYLLGIGRGGRKEGEDLLLDWMAHLSHVQKRSEGTIKGKLFAVRHYHIAAGYPDPLELSPRVWQALGGLERVGKKQNRKYPVTIGMMRWLRKKLDTGTVGDAARWAALAVAFFFMLRASEYLADPARDWGDDRVLTGRDVTPRKDGAPCVSFAGADEVVIYIKGSKTDQCNFGCCRNHYATGNDLCPAQALAELQRLAPQRWTAEGEEPLFRGVRGEPISRQEIKALLDEAALAAGIHPSHVGSHSLRIGGATAVYHAVPDLEKLRRSGRWRSSAFHAYLWEAHEPQKGLAEAMSAQDYQLTLGSANKKKPRQDWYTPKQVTFADSPPEGYPPG